MKNYITTFEDSKVTIIKDKDNAETAWYDITDIIKGLAGNRKSVLEYVTKVEMDIYRFFPNKDYGNNKLSVIRDEFESRIKAEEYSRFKCYGADGVIAAYNDAGSIRLTFKNGSGSCCFRSLILNLCLKMHIMICSWKSHKKRYKRSERAAYFKLLAKFHIWYYAIKG